MDNKELEIKWLFFVVGINLCSFAQEGDLSDNPTII